MLERRRFDLVLLDIMMPEVDGLAVLTKLRQRGALPALPVVVVTAHEDRETRMAALAAGAVDFLSEPIDRLEVVSRIRSCIELGNLRETAVQAVEHALQESEHRLRLRFEQSPVVTMDWDASFRVTDWNPAAEKLFGYRRSEVIGRHAAFILPDSRSSHADAVTQLTMVSAKGSTSDNVTKDGRTIVCEWYNTPLRSMDGTPLGFSSVVLDVTERAALQEALIDSQKMDALGKLAGGVAHDFNNILGVILSHASLVRDQLAEADSRRSDLVEVLKAAERGAALTEQLLMFSRQQPAARSPTDLLERLEDIVMPGCGGYEVVEHAARFAPQAAVVLTSSYPNEGAKDRNDELPMSWKPVSPRELVNAVARTISSEATSGPPSAAGAAEQGVDVLLVEDDEATCKAVVRVLSAIGHRVKLAPTLLSARQALERESEPRVVLCDLSLPDGSSSELLSWLRARRPGLCSRVFLLTGRALDRQAEQVVASGVFQALRKPLNPQRLLEVLAAAAPPPPVVVVESSPPSSSARPVSELRPSALELPTPSHRPSPLARATLPPRSERVLFVDGDAAFATASVRILQSSGLEVVVASTLAAARRALASGGFDVLVTDVALPDGQGLELAAELQKNCSDLPVIVITGAPSVQSAAQAIRKRVSEYLPKPFSAGKLLRAVRSAIDAGRIARLRAKLLASRFGGDELLRDLPTTERLFRRALKKLKMFFQPIVHGAGGSIFGYEALLRCDEPLLASPPRLLAAAEVLGRVHDVGRAVRASVAETMQKHRDRSEFIFVNLHPSEVRADLLATAFDPLVPLAHRVVLEVTERAHLQVGPTLDDELARIREIGYRLAADDLGEGYAGLASLVHLQSDIAKIDMSLVRGVDRAPLKRDIIAALVDMARRAKISVVAEGIETPEERETLVELGCDFLQGYLFAKPGPAFPLVRQDCRKQA